MLTREHDVINAALAVIREPNYSVIWPWVWPSTWDSMVSPVDEVREGFRIKGWASLKYAFMLAFVDVLGGLDDGCKPGLYGTLENCILGEDVFSELLQKPDHPDAPRIVRVGEIASPSFLIFIGGLWHDTKGLGKITGWILTIFIPLIRAGLRAYNSFRPNKKAKIEAKVSERGANCSTDIRILERMRKVQLAKKAHKPKQFKHAVPPAVLLATPSPTPSFSPTLPTEDDEDDFSEVSTLPGASMVTADVRPTRATFVKMDPFQGVPSPMAEDAPVLLPVTTMVTAVCATRGTCVDPFQALVSPTDEDAPVLLEAFSPKVLKRKHRLSDENLHQDQDLFTSASYDPRVAKEFRSPLTPQNLGDGSPVPFPRRLLFSGDSLAGWNLPPTGTPNDPSSPPAVGLSSCHALGLSSPRAHGPSTLHTLGLPFGALGFPSPQAQQDQTPSPQATLASSLDQMMHL